MQMSAQSVDTAQLSLTRPVGPVPTVATPPTPRSRPAHRGARHVVRSARRVELRRRRLYASAGLGVLALFFAMTVVVLDVVR
jgi:hypothetical protein